MLTSFMFGANDGNRTRLVRDHNALPVHLASFAAPMGGIEPPQHWLTASSSANELHGISWGAGLLFTSEGLRAYYLSTAPCHTYRPLSLLPAKASVHNLCRHTQRRLLCQPRLDCTV